MFEERIDALTARHEALTMNLELISHDLEMLRARSEKDDERIKALLANSERDAENIRALARIAEVHEHRLIISKGNQSRSRSGSPAAN